MHSFLTVHVFLVARFMDINCSPSPDCIKVYSWHLVSYLSKWTVRALSLVMNGESISGVHDFACACLRSYSFIWCKDGEPSQYKLISNKLQSYNKLRLMVTLSTLVILTLTCYLGFLLALDDFVSIIGTEHFKEYKGIRWNSFSIHITQTFWSILLNKESQIYCKINSRILWY